MGTASARAAGDGRKTVKRTIYTFLPNLPSA